MTQFKSHKARQRKTAPQLQARRQARRCQFEGLEKRELMTTNVYFSGSDLRIDADAAGSTVKVFDFYQAPQGVLQKWTHVQWSSPTEAIKAIAVPATFIPRIVFTGSIVADNFDASLGSTPIVAYGNGGNDVLRGGAANDVLFGGSGNDKLFGRGGYDWLYGDGDNDFLDDGSGVEYANGGAGYDYNAYQWAINGATRDDIYQGSAGNCGTMAAISALAHSGWNLSKLIQYKGDGVYRVLQYHSPGQVYYTDVSFDGTIMSGDAQPNPKQEGDFWVTVLNRALAQSIPAGLPTQFQWDAFGRLTGKGGTAYSATPLGDVDRNRIIQALQNKRPVTVLHAGHWRAVLAVRYDQISKQWMVDLRDPHGNDNGWNTGDPTDGLVSRTWSQFGGTGFSKYVIA